VRDQETLAQRPRACRAQRRPCGVRTLSHTSAPHGFPVSREGSILICSRVCLAAAVRVRHKPFQHKNFHNMTDPQEANRWRQLALDLGATPPPEEEEPLAKPEEQEPELEAAGDVAPHEEPVLPPDLAPRPPRPPTDWFRLAEELGIENAVKDPPPRTGERDLESPARKSPEASVPSDVSPRTRRGFPDLAAIGAPVADPRTAGTGPESADATRASSQPDVESMVPAARPTTGALEPAAGPGSADSETAISEAPGERAVASAEHGDRKTGRRRRKRRRKPATPADGTQAETPDQTAGPSPREPVGELGEVSGDARRRSPDLAPISAGALDPRTAGDESSAEAGQAPAGSEERERRPGPRRAEPAAVEGDRSAQSGSGPELAVAENQSDGTGATGSTPSARRGSPDPAAGGKPTRAEGEVSATQEAAGEKEKREKASKRPKPSHRGIPTWAEAVGLVITANMESRARNRGRGSSSRSRPARNRGAAAREKSGEKPA
jgi:hypothetical protein